MATGDLDFDDYKEEQEDDISAMSLVDHLEELRWRIFKCLIAVVIGTIIAFVFREQIVLFLSAPLPIMTDSALGRGGKPILTGIGVGLTAIVLVSIGEGGLVALLAVLIRPVA